MLCDAGAQRAERGRQLCRELRCGNLSSSAEIRDPPVAGVVCRVPTLHLCHGNLERHQSCSRTRVVCKSPRRGVPGVMLGAGISIPRHPPPPAPGTGRRVQGMGTAQPGHKGLVG